MIYLYGHSDDLVEMEVSGIGGLDEEYDGPTSFEFGNKDFGGVRVEMTYDSPGVWAAKVSQLEEGVPIPWDIHIKHNHSFDGKSIGYSVMVILDIPGDPWKLGLKIDSLEDQDD